MPSDLKSREPAALSDGTMPLRRAWARAANGWSLAALLLTALAVLPIASIALQALSPKGNVWPHLLATVLPRYLVNTGLLMLAVAVLAVAMGTGAAWIVTMYRFAGQRVLVLALALPLAVPAYIAAFALTDFLDYSGPLQAGLRAAAGWTSARDYWFPEVRSLPFAALVLAGGLYPYIYLLVRAALREQSGGLYEVARALGSGPIALFWRVGLPLSRPAIAAGTALVLMEVVADYGAVQHFGVQTLTMGVYSTWLNGGNAGGAAQIALVILTLVMVLLLTERRGRRGARFHRPARPSRPVEPRRLQGARAALAAGLCLMPVLLGFVLPVGVMLRHGLGSLSVWADPALWRAVVNTILTGGAAALATLGAGFLAAYGLRRMGQGLARGLAPLSMLSYAAPGAVLAVGILVPLAALDHGLADLTLALTGRDPGLLLTGTGFALVLAYGLRFFGIAESAMDAAFGRIAPSVPLAARSLGRTEGAVLREVSLPMIRGSLAATLLLVFVECVKELPATLLLRPFNFETLATRAFEKASLEQLGQAAPAALAVIAVAMVAMVIHTRGDNGPA